MRFIPIILMLLMMNNLFAGGACIPINEIRVLKKAIVSLELDKKQFSEFVKLEDALKENIQTIQKDAKQGKNGTFSSLFNKTTFQRDEFLKSTGKQNEKISIAIAEYFEKLYAMLNSTQKELLIQKFEKIEHRKSRK
ncbi:hypothetical protein SAMN06314042_11515 [Epsilonproteobacteria bacterium SCGC AD-308-O04]|nr:hypothetical protein SAMN06314042_11515 [Epsilonproteobacteria bacterium SCGC AD-308-O04]